MKTIAILLAAFMLVVGIPFMRHGDFLQMSTSSHDHQKLNPEDKGPLLIPVQTRFNESAESDLSDPSAAPIQTAWENILASLAEGRTLKDISNQITEIIERYPDSIPAVEAQLMVLSDELGNIKENQNISLLEEYVQRALMYPSRYFSLRHEAASQIVASSLILRLISQNQIDKASQLCLKLRWQSPRLEHIAPICQKLMEDNHPTRSESQDILASLPSALEYLQIDDQAVGNNGATIIRRYLGNPYDSDNMARMLVILWQGQHNKAAITLRNELLGLNPEMLWKLESNARSFGSIKGFLRLCLIPWNFENAGQK